MNMNEEQRNRELAFLEFEIKEIEKANLHPGFPMRTIWHRKEIYIKYT